MAVRATVETRWLPPLNVQAPAPGAKPDLLLSILKPKVTFYTDDQDLVTVAPYGEPGKSLWPIYLAFQVLSAVWLAKRLAR